MQLVTVARGVLKSFEVSAPMKNPEELEKHDRPGIFFL